MTSRTELLPAATDVAELVDQVTQAYAGAPSMPVPFDERSTPQVFGVVEVEGAFHGQVTVACTEEFLRKLTIRMLRLAEDAPLSKADREDALSEFTNVVGGNIKALISERVGATCRLRLPRVEGTPTDVPSGLSMSFACDDELFRVEVAELAQSGAT